MHPRIPNFSTSLPNQRILRIFIIRNLDNSNWIYHNFRIVSLIQATRYGYYKTVRSYMNKFVKSKYQGQDRDRKIDVFLKLSFDAIFYLIVTIYFFIEFRQEYWFPSAVGG